MTLRLDQISAEKLKSLPRDKTVFFLPVGALEDHGPHLPLGTSLLEAERLCQIAAERVEKELSGWSGVIGPSSPLAIQGYTTQAAFTVRPHVLRDWLVDFCGAMGRLGFKHFVCFTGNPGPRQLATIEDAGKIVRRKLGGSPLIRRLVRRGTVTPSLVSALSGLTQASDLRTAPFWPDPLEHGGESATSLVLLTAPDLVGSYAELPELSRPGTFWSRAWERFKHRRAGYWGNPAKGTAQKAESRLATIVGDAFPKLRAVWAGANPHALFRSWYSVLPPNRSFFKVWVLFFAFLAILSAYLYLGVD